MQQIIIQPRGGVSAGQVVLIVLAVIVLTPVVTCAVCTMAVGAGVNAASQNTRTTPAIAANQPAPTPPVINQPAKAATTPEPEAAKAATTPEPEAAKPTEPDPALSRWRYDLRKDEMSGQSLRRAMLVSDTTYDFAFPYHGGTHCGIRISEHPDNGLTITVNIDNGQFVCHRATRCQIAVRFDERPQMKFRGVEPEDYNTKMIFLEPEKKFLKEIKTSREMVIELPFYQEGRRIFKFNTADLQWD